MDANDRGWLGLHDRVCVITGAASGIGRETAIQFATVGARVVAIDRDGNGCSRTAEEVQQQGAGQPWRWNAMFPTPRVFLRRRPGRWLLSADATF